MRLKLGTFELIMHKRKNRPKWTRVAHIMPTPQKVVDYACYLFDLLEDDLHTGARYGEIPDCKKLISLTLYECGYSQRKIAEMYPWLGDRSTVYAQVNAAKTYTAKTHVSFAAKKEQMFKKFLK